jgi:DNA polymerase
MKKPHLHIDIETFSDVDLKSAGVHKYCESDAFEILVVAFALNDQPAECYDWKDLPEYFFEMLEDENVMKFAHNAAFERTCFAAEGYPTPATSWRCTMVKALYCGLPGSLDKLSTILHLQNAKLKSGTALINYWCKPVKATKINGGRTRNLKEHNLDKWNDFKEYCRMDVEAEKELVHALDSIKMRVADWQDWALDQEINDKGVLIDEALVDAATALSDTHNEALIERTKILTRLDNPNSLAQIKSWLSDRTGRTITDLTKDAVKELLKSESDTAIREVLQIRQQLGKTSVKKYVAMTAGACDDGRSRGLFQFYGANRTGRWAGRRVQLQNLPRNEIKDLTTARYVVRDTDYDLVSMFYDDIPDTLSQLIRTAIIPAKGMSLVACDFSAIEARVIAFLAGEEWRLKVFQSHGKIYEASAAQMFNIPIETIGKDSPYRQRGKVAELALGYQGGVNALLRMGGDRLGLSEFEMQTIVDKWRSVNPMIVKMWADFNQLALMAVSNGRAYTHASGITFSGTPNSMRVRLLSGRELIYWGAKVVKGRFGNVVKYKGVDDRNQWTDIDTYGGKLVENIVQAVSRDLLVHSMHRIKEEVFGDMILHVHDEVAIECRTEIAEDNLKQMEQIMAEPPIWAQGLPLSSEGFVGQFYKK